MSLFIPEIPELFWSVIVRRYDRELRQLFNPGAYDFRMRCQAISAAYLPFQLGVRLLRKASIPSRKSSLI
jgi:hypothetical protein